MGSPVADALASAKAELEKANKKFPSPKPTGGGVASAPAKPVEKKAPGMENIREENRRAAEEEGKKIGMAGMPILHEGTKKVKKTGPAVLEKDEAVIPKDKAKKNRGLIEGLLDGKEAKEEKEEGKKDSPKEEKKEHEKKKPAKKPKHRVHTMHVKRAKGGFIVNHEVEPGEGGTMPTSEENPPHVVSDMAGLHAHMDEHLGDEASGSLADAQPSAGMPQA